MKNYGGVVTAHFVTPAQFVADDKMCTFNGTFCRTLHTLSPQKRQNVHQFTAHCVPPERARERDELCAYILPRVWCIASALRQVFPNWPWKFYCILIKEIVDSWNYLFIIYERISSMLLHWIPSKQGWINVGLVGNSFAPNWLDLPNNWNCKTRTISKEMKILDLLKGPDTYT